MITAQDIRIAYAGRPPVVEGVSFALEEGQTLAVVGPSGCGKTTLLYALAGLLRPAAGSIRLQGREVLSATPEISIILQDYGLLPWKNVLQNVALGLKIRGMARAERNTRAREQLAELGIVGRDRDYPGRLSGGEQQRVAIARAFVSRPKVLLLDEPFSSLDALTRERLQMALLEIWRKRRTPYVLVTHSLEEAVFLGARILVLAGRPARPVACLDNPGFGDPRLRERDDYFQTLRTLRSIVEREWEGRP